MRTLTFDTETTGLPKRDLPADHPSQPRIVSIAWRIDRDPVGGGTRQIHYLIKPDGWTIETGAAAAHGLTLEVLEQDGIPIREAMEKFCACHDAADLLMAYNASFDLKLIRDELRRLGMDERYSKKPIRDLMFECTPICKMTSKFKSSYKWPKLSEAVKIILKRDHAGAHDAMADVDACADLATAIDAMKLGDKPIDP